jgi:hypothetical protein
VRTSEERGRRVALPLILVVAIPLDLVFLAGLVGDFVGGNWIDLPINAAGFVLLTWSTVEVLKEIRQGTRRPEPEWSQSRALRVAGVAVVIYGLTRLGFRLADKAGAAVGFAVPLAIVAFLALATLVADILAKWWLARHPPSPPA